MPRRKKNDLTYKPYDVEFHPDDLVTRMANGETNVEIMASWNISEPTFYNWRNQHEELAEAYERGLVKFEAWFIKNRFNLMIEGKLEGKHAFMSAMAIANNKLHWKRSNGSEDNKTTNININSMNVLNHNTSIDQIKESLLKDLDYLQHNNIIDVKVIDDRSNESN